MKTQNSLNVYLLTLRQKGYLAYEYNPFHNYLTDTDLYEVDTDVGKVLAPKDSVVNKKNGLFLKLKTWYDKVKNSTEFVYVDDDNNIINDYIVVDNTLTLFAKAGSLIDLDTDKLNFDLEHPVDIEVLPSYDGSVNLILNDDKNIPRLINSRFSAREKNTYEIVDRIGENDTNIYNSNTFDKDTSLYFLYEYNPTILYMNYIKGIFPVGLYCFYFTYCDSDNNESDYIAETGLIPLFIGSDRDPFSMDGGIKNQDSNKGVRLKLRNLDKSYNYLRVYYLRYFADYLLNRVYELKKIYKKYPINSDILYLQITGYEETEDLDPNILNISRFNPKNVLTQALCKNILFFGNIVKNSDNYRELIDCSLRIIPEMYTKTMSLVDNNYETKDGTYGYYDSTNIYNNVGYFNQEYYRFGVVYIYQNGTLSNVYNTLGFRLNENEKIKYKEDTLYDNIVEDVLKSRKYIEIDDKGWIKNVSRTFNLETTEIPFPSYINSKGVCLFDLDKVDSDQIIGIKFNIPDEVITHLKKDLGIRGLFFVRQKCIPNILAQCYLLPMDETLEAPVIECNKGVFTECFVSLKDRLVKNDYEDRLYKYKTTPVNTTAYAAICPDFLLNLPYYNQIFNGSQFRLAAITSDNGLEKNGRMYTEKTEGQEKGKSNTKVTICSVTENVSSVAIKDKVFKLNQGQAEEAYRFTYAEDDNGTYSAGDEDYDSVNEATNIVRGIYSPYLAIYSPTRLATGITYNIYTNSEINTNQEFLNRMDSSEPFYAISDRYNFSGLEGGNTLICWRGDCFINTFTYRLNRNFNDPSLPNNDKIIVPETWKENYNVAEPENFSNISRSDVNAVLMGSWITLKVRSSMNYALRSEDHSYVAEEALMGAPRSFYPRSRLMWRGENKMPDSYLYNDAYRASLGYKCYFTLQDINYIKDTFSNRIQYSAISIQDSFKNNYRESLSTYFRDYSQEYGSILKLVESNGNLIVVFEHGVGIAAVNERILAGEGDGGQVFINTQNVLPEELLILTDNYGTQWPESVIKSEVGYIYGVDTISKKIWRIKGQLFELLSDFKVNKFLIDNISLGERELNPIIGLKNVKTHYNNNKKDIMFTFYDDIYKGEEKVWNLCYNELLDLFITFYSWIPSYSENIDTKFFTFNRNTSKWLTLLNKCNYNIFSNLGVVVDLPIMTLNEEGKYSVDLYYRDPNAIGYITILNSDGTTTMRLELPQIDKTTGLADVKFKLEKDNWGYWKYVSNRDDLLVLSNNKIIFDDSILEVFNKVPVITLEITPFIDSYSENEIDTSELLLMFKTETIALTTKEIVDNLLITKEDKSKLGLTTYFYLHGQAGIFNITEDTYPCYWYNEQHPFEFEFIVNDKIGQLKIFEDLVIISNKAEPESFHFEIEGDNYEFSSDKRTMYFRQEATKNLFLNLGSDIIYDRKFTDVVANKLTQEQYYRAKNDNYSKLYIRLDRVYPVLEKGLVQQVKSTIFPLYYNRTDTFNEIYHTYNLMKGEGYDFLNLSGSEITWNRDLNLFNIVTHIKNSPINQVGRLRGNSYYKEGKWNVLIPSITFMLKNEERWPTISDYSQTNYFKLCQSTLCGGDRLGTPSSEYADLLSKGPMNGTTIPVPPIIINTNYPMAIDFQKIPITLIPNIYCGDSYIGNVKFDNWTYRREARIRDKWIKIRVRYSGKNLAVIHSIVTLYNVSYS